jgi:hypothetical protein
MPIPTASNSSHGKRRTICALKPEKRPIPSDTTHSEAYSQPNWAGVTEQLRFSIQSMFWPETVAKRKYGIRHR